MKDEMENIVYYADKDLYKCKCGMKWDGLYAKKHGSITFHVFHSIIHKSYKDKQSND